MLSLYRESVRSNRTINRILSTVHTFYRYQADMYEIDNPILMHEINRPFNMFKGILAHTRSDNKIKQSVRVDYAKLISGEDDWICKESEFFPIR